MTVPLTSADLLKLAQDLRDGNSPGLHDSRAWANYVADQLSGAANQLTAAHSRAAATARAIKHCIIEDPYWAGCYGICYSKPDSTNLFADMRGGWTPEELEAIAGDIRRRVAARKPIKTALDAGGGT